MPEVSPLETEVEVMIDHDARAEARSAKEAINRHEETCLHERERWTRDFETLNGRVEQGFNEARGDAREIRQAIADTSNSYSQGLSRVHDKVESRDKWMLGGAFGFLVLIIGFLVAVVIELGKLTTHLPA